MNGHVITLDTGDTITLPRDNRGWYCPICGDGPWVSAPFEQAGEYIHTASGDICPSCNVEYGVDIDLFPNSKAEEFGHALFIFRLHVLCQKGWSPALVAQICRNLNISNTEIQEMKHLAGGNHGLDLPFREARTVEDGPFATCPCCGRMNAVRMMLTRCFFCGWIYAPLQIIAPDSMSGPNGRLSLRKAQECVRRTGVVSELVRDFVETPGPNNSIDPAWTPLPDAVR